MRDAPSHSTGCFPRHILVHTFFYAFGMFVPINVLLALIYPKNPHSPLTLLRIVSTPTHSCSPLAIWLEINFAAYCCLPDYTYWVWVSVSQWTVTLPGIVISFSTSLLLLLHITQFLHRTDANESFLELNDIHKLYKTTSLDGFLLNSWSSPAFR